MFSARNIRYDLAERTRGLACGGHHQVRFSQRFDKRWTLWRVKAGFVLKFTGKIEKGCCIGGQVSVRAEGQAEVSAPQNHAAVVERAGGFGSRRAFSGLIGCAGVRRGGIACARLGRGVR